VWESRDDLLADPAVKIVGYQVNYADPNAGLVLFSHETPDCGTSLAVTMREFRDFYFGPICEDLLENTDECPGYCKNRDSLEPCFGKCKCTFARDILQILRDWPKGEDFKSANA